jgi:hypothetical protein
VTEPARAIRLFLDSGVIIEGCVSPWGAAKAVLILATIRTRFAVVLAEAVEREVQRAIATKTAGLDPAAARAIGASVAGWLARVRLERQPLPSEEAIRAHAARVLPILRHVNDLPVVVSAIQARPDWVVSTNREHWSDALGVRTGLRIAAPYEFLGQLAPREW